MPASVLYMSMSMDGYIAGPNDEPGNPGGDGFGRLHEWFVTPEGKFFRPSEPAGQLMDEWYATGAVLVGRRTAEQIEHFERRGIRAETSFYLIRPNKSFAPYS